MRKIMNRRAPAGYRLAAQQAALQLVKAEQGTYRLRGEVAGNQADNRSSTRVCISSRVR